MKILDVKINELNRKEALKRVVGFLNSRPPLNLPLKKGRQFKIFTPNPEMLVKANSDKYFKDVLNLGDLNLPDGRGLQLVSRGKLKNIPGVDFMLYISALAEKVNKTIYLLGSGEEDVIENTKKNLLQKFPNLKICGFDKGPKIKEVENKLEVENNGEIINKINQARPDILFVAFGMGKQEKWISENLSKMPSVKIAMGVGGSFDFISGKLKRAPKILQKLWLEWLWRLVQEPKRIIRIYNATFKFLYLYAKSKR